MNSLRDSPTGKALAIGVLALGAIYFMVVTPLRSYYESTEQRLQERQELVQRYKNSARDLPRLREAGTHQRDQSGDLLLTGSTDAVAAATLQSALKDLAEQEGAKLTSAEMLPSETQDDVVRRVGVRIAFSGDLTLLATILEGVETARPVLSVANLEVHAGGSNEEDERDALAIVVDVYGFLSQ